jgi:predicted transcriptional regulator
MRRDGFDYETIAEKLGVTVATAHSYITRYRGEMVKPDAAQYFDELFADLRNLRVRLQPGVMEGDPQAIRAALAVNESARKMLGLDAPVRADVTVTELSEEDRAFAEMLREEAARNAVERAEAPSEG